MVHIPPLWKQRGTTFQMTVFSCSVVHITQPSSLFYVIISYSPVNTCRLHTLCHCHNKMVQCVCSEGCGHLWSVFITYDGNKSTTYIIRSAPCSSHIHNYTHMHMHTHTYIHNALSYSHTQAHIYTLTLSLLFTYHTLSFAVASLGSFLSWCWSSCHPPQLLSHWQLDNRHR